MNHTALEIAARMLHLGGPNDVPADLFRRIAYTQKLIESVGGEFRSRQVLAMIIMQWEEDKTTRAYAKRNAGQSPASDMFGKSGGNDEY